MKTVLASVFLALSRKPILRDDAAAEARRPNRNLFNPPASTTNFHILPVRQPTSHTTTHSIANLSSTHTDPTRMMAATTSEIIQRKTQRPASEDLLSEKVLTAGQLSYPLLPALLGPPLIHLSTVGPMPLQPRR